MAPPPHSVNKNVMALISAPRPNELNQFHSVIKNVELVALGVLHRAALAPLPLAIQVYQRWGRGVGPLLTQRLKLLPLPIRT